MKPGTNEPTNATKDESQHTQVPVEKRGGRTYLILSVNDAKGYCENVYHALNEALKYATEEEEPILLYCIRKITRVSGILTDNFGVSKKPISNTLLRDMQLAESKENAAKETERLRTATKSSDADVSIL